jgi:hypothetical protein
MRTFVEGSVNRRYAIGGMAAAAAGLALPSRFQGRAITQRGMAGGGLVRLESGDAAFSVLASRVLIEGQDDVIVGSIKWVDESAGFDFASTTISEYEVLESPEEGGELRRIIGMMRLNEKEDYPFSINVLDAGDPGSGLDSIALIVGDGATTDGDATPISGLGFSYAAAGEVIGDVQDVDFEFGGA